MSFRRAYQLCLVLIVLFSYCWPAVKSSYYPLYGEGASVSFNALDGNRFPNNEHIVESAYQYFLSEPTFDVVDGKVICGAADKLYVLNVGDLAEVTSLSWEPETAKKTQCLSQVTESPEYNCRNHIRVHQPIPAVTAGNPALMVCGTQATKTPQCRVVTVENGGSLLQGFTTDASEGIISYYPDFSQFGEFRNDTAADSTYFTAGFFEGGSGLGRHFSISFQNITVSDNPTPNSLTTTERFRTITANNNWLRFPVTFVDYFKLDYVPDAGGNEYDYQFYFAFIRENSAATSSDGVIQSRVVRICRNDAGFNLGGSDLPYFITYMKARIFCERQQEPGDQFEAGQEFLYNELRSVAFTEGGRYRDNDAYGKKLYGAFTGPIVGPHGTAICVYNAENTEEMGGNGRSQSMFDIFREDLQTPDGGRNENDYIKCDPAGRTSEQAQNILVNEEKFVSQLESDPLIVMDGLFVNQIVLDEQCVVKHDDPNSCLNQDVLFLGTDSGKVLKVVFARDGDSGIFPVVAEEISLDDDNNIEKMVIHDEGEGGRNLFVNTNSKIYKFPLAECSRHQTCLDCVVVRDPYCVWNVDENRCVSNPFSVSGDGTVTVNGTRFKQNIHSGGTDECMAQPFCVVNASSIDYETIQVEATCTNANQITVAVSPSNDLTIADSVISLSSEGTGSTTISGGKGLQSYNILVTATQTGVSNSVTITTIVTTPPGPPVPVETRQILIDSIMSSSFRVTVNVDKFTDYFSQYSFKLQGEITGGPQSFTEGTSLTLTNLTPATDYTFTVAITNSIATVTSSQLTVRTLDSVPSPVRNLVSESGMRNVALDWDEPSTTNGDIIGYSVKVGGVEVRGCGGWGNAVATTYDVIGLSPYADYTFSVAACTSAGEGPTVTISQRTLCSNPEQVNNLQIMPTSATTLQYSWSVPDVVNGPMDSSTLRYEVVRTCYPESGVTTNSLTIQHGQDTSTSISSLLPLTLCCVKVTAVNSCPEQETLSGAPSEICGSTNDVIPGSVTSLTATGVSREAILITWAPPTNYERSGLDYVISIAASHLATVEDTVTDINYYYRGGLEPAKQYTVSVRARSGGGTEEVNEVEVHTLPDSPPPPGNLSLAVADSNTLTLSWDSVGGVSHYVAVLRCNEQDPQTATVAGSETSVDFNVSTPEPNFAWCTAQVQSENQVGHGRFSDLVSVAIPSSSPATPRCYLVDDQGSLVTFSFDVTHPFSFDSLSLSYKLIPDFEDESSVEEETEVFTGNNVVMVPVSRNTIYTFRLKLCNVHGCSDYCTQLTNFTTSSVAPRPPSEIMVSDVTHDSVVLSWDIPDFENASSISYLLHVTSSGSGGGQTFSIGGIVTSHMLSGLDAETMYSVAIQVRDIVTEIEGVFGPAKSFVTIPGTPSRPTALEANWVSTRRELSVSWGPPNVTNGTIRSYELVYSGEGTGECNRLGNDAITITLDYKARGYITTETSAILDTKSFIVCVRGDTDTPGEWAVYRELDVDIAAVSGTTTTEEGKANCSGLIAVAVVAGVAVVSTVIAAVVLFVVVRHHNNHVSDRQKSDGQSSSSSDQVGGEGTTTRYDRSSPSRGSNDTGFEEQQTRPPLQSQDSIASTNTLKPLLSNGRS